MAKAKNPQITTPDMSKEDIQVSLQDIRTHYLAKNQNTATTLDNFHALALTIRHRIVDSWMKTQSRYHNNNVRRVSYLSLEFLIGGFWVITCSIWEKKKTLKPRLLKWVLI